jgi:hypothetical protein
MRILDDTMQALVVGGTWNCAEPPPEPPSAVAWLPPNPDNPTSSSPTEGASS